MATPDIDLEVLHRRGWRALLLASLLIGATVMASGLGLHRSATRVALTTGRAAQAREVQSEIQRLVSLLKDAESGQRGYLLTGHEAYLEPYRLAVGQVTPRLEHISELLEPSSAQRPRIERLRVLTGEKLAELAEGIRRRQQGELVAAVALLDSDRGKALMGEASEVISALQAEENRLRAERTAEASQAVDRATAASLLATLLVLALVAVVFLSGRWSSERVRRSSQWLRVTLRSIGDGVIATDREGLVRFMNPVAEQLTGWTESEAQGRPLDEVFCIVSEQTRVPVKNPVATVLATGVVVGLANHTLLISRDGTERSIEDSGAPIRDDEGHVTGVVLVFVDQTKRRMAERMLAQNEREFRASFELAGVGKAQTDPATGRFVRVNRKLCEMTGYTAEELLERTFLDITHPDDRDADRARFEAAIADGRPVYATQKRYVRKDGESVFVRLTTTFVRDENDRAIRTISVIEDITERLRAEQSLRERTDLLRAITESTDDLIYAKDVSSRMTLANPRTLAIIGKAADEVLGRTDEEWSHDVEQGRKLMANDRQVLETGRAQAVEEAFGPVGDVRVYLSTKAPLRASDGTVMGVVGISRDITERKQAEERLHLLEAISQATLHVTDAEGVMDVTTRLVGEHLGVTRCAYADVEADSDRFTIRHDWAVPGATSTVGVYSLQLFGPRAVAELHAGQTLRVADVDRELAPTEGAGMFNAIGIKAIICCPLVRHDRLVAMMAVHQATPRAWTDAEVALLEEVVDRSWAHIERVRATLVLREQDRRKDEFLATLAHELRNPLAPIQTGLDLLRQSPTRDPATARTQDVMERQLRHMVHLIDDLLDVSRINQGKLEIRGERMKVQTVLDHAIEAVQAQAEQAGHTLTVRVPDEAIWVQGDLTRLAQVVGNLLHNAIKYTPQGGRIDVSATTEGPDAVVRISDNGVGIAPEMLRQIFSLFTQVNRTLSRAQGGLGIGLSLARTLIEMHGGTLDAQSPGPGQGSTFTLRLPVARPPSGRSLSSAPRPGPAGAVASAARRILVVDDNEDGAEMLALMLTRRGHQTRTAYTGEDALEAVRSFDPDTVFLDIGLPGLSGHEVARQLRDAPDLAHLTLVALTGWGAEADKQKSQEAGFDAHLTKPVDAAAVADVLAQFPPRR